MQQQQTTTEPKAPEPKAPWSRPDYKPHVRALGDRAFGTQDLPAAFDARKDAHMPSLRPTGPYTTSRVTFSFSDNAIFHQFGTFRVRAGTTSPWGEWSNIVALVGNVDTTAINSVTLPGNATIMGFKSGIFDSRTQVSPCAMTLRVTCTDNITTAAGNVYFARVNAGMDLANSAETWRSIGDQVIQYLTPDVVPAASMVLDARIMHAYPLDSELLGEFTDMDSLGGADVGIPTVWNMGTGPSQYGPCGLTPLVVVNRSGRPLEYTLTIQYRTRFSIGHAASSTHKQHKATPVPTYEAAVTTLQAAGHTIAESAEGYGLVRGAVAAGEMLGMIAV